MSLKCAQWNNMSNKHFPPTCHSCLHHHTHPLSNILQHSDSLFQSKAGYPNSSPKLKEVQCYINQQPCTWLGEVNADPTHLTQEQTLRSVHYLRLRAVAANNVKPSSSLRRLLQPNTPLSALLSEYFAHTTV